jgi:hypothetical protein
VGADERWCVEAEDPAALGERTHALGLFGDGPATLGVGEHGHEACSLDLLRGLDDERDRILEVEP